MISVYEAIEALKDMPISTTARYPETFEAIYMAIDALKEKENRQNKNKKKNCNFDKGASFRCDCFYVERIGDEFFPRCSHGAIPWSIKAKAICQDDIFNCPYVVAVAEWLQNCLGWKKP